MCNSLIVLYGRLFFGHFTPHTQTSSFKRMRKTKVLHAGLIVVSSSSCASIHSILSPEWKTICGYTQSGLLKAEITLISRTLLTHTHTERFPSRTPLNNDANIAQSRLKRRQTESFYSSRLTITTSSSRTFTPSVVPQKFGLCSQTIPASFGLKAEQAAAPHFQSQELKRLASFLAS